MKLFTFRLLALVGMLCLLPAMASAASDMFLKIKGVKGEARIVACPGGVCVVDGLAPGKYSVEVCDAKGNVIPTDLALGYDVVSPRDAASGLPTGRRQHKPIRISSQSGGSPTNVIEVTEAGAQVSIQVDTKAQDHNSSRSNKSS